MKESIKTKKIKIKFEYCKEKNSHTIANVKKNKKMNYVI